VKHAQDKVHNNFCNAALRCIEANEIPEVDGIPLVYRANAPGMPQPGAALVQAAKALFSGDDETTALTKLYFMALYSKQPIVVGVSYRQSWHSVPLMPGHIWGSRGIRRADVMVIGKMPGREEMQQQRNFVGPSGQLLRQLLNQCGIDDKQYNDWFVTNVVRWYVDGISTLPVAWVNECAPLLHQELRLVRPRVLLLLGTEAVRAIFGQRSNPRILATQDLTFEFPVGTATGSNEVHTTKVFIALHPAAVCRRPEMEPVLLNDLRRLATYIKTGTVTNKNSQITWDVITDADALECVIEEVSAINGVKKIAIDLEWDGRFPTEPGAYVRTIQISYRPQHAVVIKMHNADGTPAFMPHNDAAVVLLNKLLRLDGVQLGGAHIAADIPWLQSIGVCVDHLLRVPQSLNDFVGGQYPGLFDVALAEHAYNETGPFDLESIAAIRCGYAPWSADLLRWRAARVSELKIADADLPGYGACPDDVLIPYAAIDAAVTRELMDVYCNLLNADRFGNSCWEPFHRAMRAAPAFIEMHCTGVMVDRERLDRITDSYMRAYEQRLAELREEIRWPEFNPRSHVHSTELLFGERYTNKRDATTNAPICVRPPGAMSLNLSPVKSTDKRPWTEYDDLARPSTDKEVCGILALSHPIAGKLRDVRFLDHVLKSVLRPPAVDDDDERTYSGGLAKFICADGRVHSFFRQLVETGRASSARPPLQNLAKRREGAYSRLLGDLYCAPIRSIICATPGYKLIEADFMLAEVLCEAVLAGETLLIEHCYRASLPPDHPDHYDIHSQMAVRAFRLDCPPTKEGLESVGALPLRVAAKNIVFGSLYGRAPEAVARQCQEEGNNVTVEDAKRIMDTLFGTYPGLATLQQAIRDRVVSVGWLRTYWGRLRRFYLSTDPTTVAAQQREALNFPAQSMVADAMNEALYNLYTFPDRHKLGYRIVLQLHDACMLEVPEKHAELVAREIMPLCMKSVKFKSCDLSGNPISDKLYNFEVDVNIYDHWGE